MRAPADAPRDATAAIRAALPRLSRAEAQVGEAVLAAPDEALEWSISKLARAAGVSEPTVNRFCRSLGYAGYAAFRLGLAQSLVRGTPFVSADVERGDPPAVYAAKLFDAGALALRRARDALDPAAIAEAVLALGQARQILFFGLGGSGPVALDAQHKFARIDIPAVAHSDPIMQRIAAIGLGPRDVVVAISSTGRTRLVVDAVRLACGAGACVVAITRPDSALAREATIVLGVEPAEDSDRYTPTGSRLVHLAMIDALLTGVILGREPGFVDRLRRLKEALADTRLPDAATAAPLLA
ncbi:MAG TPA: transcriptional regulator HexR [Geminicoccaceae bacterium]|nr:transcriptional regulator HexR [Geminicoccaceae bacterium]